MASPVFSTLFGSAPSTSGGPFTIYTVPADKVAVIKTITIVFGDVTASGVDAWVQTQDTTKLWRYTWAATLSEPQNFGGTSRFWGMHVVRPTNQIQVQTAAGTVDFSVSGYLLQLP